MSFYKMCRLFVDKFFNRKHLTTSKLKIRVNEANFTL